MRVAAIDCGTNSIRLLIADVSGDRLTDVARRMELVRLGEGVDRTGFLQPAAIERTRQALLGYAAEIAELGVDRVRMCATSASRDASNAADFRAMVRAVLGVDPEVITGDEEARLSFAGAVHGLVADPPYLIVDIGGGSTEFVTGGTEPDSAISMDIGCVRMTERHLQIGSADPGRDRRGRAGHHRGGRHGARGRARPGREDPGRAGRFGHHGDRAGSGPPGVRRDAHPPRADLLRRGGQGDRRVAGRDGRRAAAAAGDAPGPGRRDRRRRAHPADHHGARRADRRWWPASTTSSTASPSAWPAESRP